MKSKISIEAGEALDKGAFVTLNGSNQAVTADATAQVIGVTEHSAESGEEVTLIVAGIADVRFSAALARFAALGPDANGRAQEASNGGAVAAMALEETGVAASGTDYVLAKCLLMLEGRGYEQRTLSISAGAEASDVIELTLAQNIPRADQWYAVVIGEDDGLPEAATAFHLEATTGTNVSTADQAGLVFDLTSDGEAVLEVTDVAGASGATVSIVFYPLDSPGVIHRNSITFD